MLIDDLIVFGIITGIKINKNYNLKAIKLKSQIAIINYTDDCIREENNYFYLYPFQAH